MRREGAALARFAAARHRRPPRAFFIYRRRLSGVSSASTPRPRHHEPLRRSAWIRRAAQSGFAFHPSPSAPFFFSALAASDAAFGFADAEAAGVPAMRRWGSAAVVQVDAHRSGRKYMYTLVVVQLLAAGCQLLHCRPARGAAVFPAAHATVDHLE